MVYAGGQHKLNIPSSSSCSACGKTPPWCRHKPEAAEETRRSCASLPFACEPGLTCGSLPSTDTLRTEGLFDRTEMGEWEGEEKDIRFWRVNASKSIEKKKGVNSQKGHNEWKKVHPQLWHHQSRDVSD